MTAALEHFHPLREVTTDERTRVALGAAGERNARYLVSKSDDGAILLTPMASIPAREMLVWENAAVRSSLMRGLEEAHLGMTVRRDDLLDDVEDE